MCTAIHDRHLFGRTLDLECSFGECVTVTPRAYPFHFLYEQAQPTHLAMIGVAHIADGVPLYYDAVNEAGLSIAGLNFSGNAVYHPPRTGARNVASFELIPWLLGQCETLEEAKKLLAHTNITPDAFRADLPASPLHWLIADSRGGITVESVATGLEVYPNPVGVLTNDPPFAYHMTHLSDYMQLSPAPPPNRLCPSVTLAHYSRGMGALGLPGDFASPSRFVRAVYAKNHTTAEASEQSEISRFFHVMDTVSQPRGCALSDKGAPISTIYTSCADTARGIYYFTTYEYRRIRAVKLHGTDLDTATLTHFPMDKKEDIENLNG